MSTVATQSTRGLAVSTPFGEDVVLLRNLHGMEELSSPFEYRLDLLSTDDRLDATQIVGQNVTITIDRDGSETRYINGYVSQFRHAGHDDRFTAYRATVVPWLWFLTQTTDCRIFQKKTVPQIVERIFKVLGFMDYEFKLSGNYRPREYCVQYRETAFEFISRLLEDEGIHYYFRHGNGSHRLILGDRPANFFDLPDNEVEYANPNQTAGILDQIKLWERKYTFRPGRYAHTDYNFKRPSKRLMANESSQSPIGPNAPFEIYEYPGGHFGKPVGRRRARVRMEEIEATRDVVRGVSTYRSFTPGGRFTVAYHRSPAERGNEYTLLSVETMASVSNYETADGQLGCDDAEVEFENRFTCILADTPFRPARSTRKPIVEGPQTATVVGPPGEEIYPDKYGRVKCHFHWDRQGRKNDKDSCWIRVSQTHAGNGWGSIHLPRIGEEVIVSFLEGDPDRPIIKGRVYNAKQKVPFGLPGEMTRSGGKSDTHKGSGYNEMTMDDTAGNEQIRVNAQYNMDTTVGNNQTLAIGVDRTDSIGNNDTRTVAVDSTATIGNNRAATVGNNETVTVGNNILIEAGTSITLACGASTIHMNQAGVIMISGTYVTSAAMALNSIIAPMTEIAGSNMLNQVGMVNLMLGGVCKVKGGETDVKGATVDVRGGQVVVKGAPIKLGGAGMAIVKFPHKIAGLPVTPNPDGTISVGKGITIGGDSVYKMQVLNELGTIGSTQEGQSLLHSLESSGNTAQLIPLSPPENPSNAFAMPHDILDAHPAGHPVTFTDSEGNLVNAGTGTGRGTDSTVRYNPTDWPDPTTRTRAPGDVILFHELEHANNNANGSADWTPRNDNFDDNEEYQTIQRENKYRDERNVPRRRDHHDL